MKGKKELIALALLIVASGAKADEITEITNTVFVYADYGLGTYKSRLVDSNDTMGVTTYGFGTFAGQERTLGFEYRVEKQTVSFAVNESSLMSAWTSMMIKYRWWLFELGPVLGGAKMKVEREGDEILDVVSDGLGWYLGFLFPTNRGNFIYVNGMSVTSTSTVDQNQRAIKLGPRLDLAVGGRFALTRDALSFDVGYRRRANAVTEGDVRYSELQTATYFGLNVGRTF